MSSPKSIIKKYHNPFNTSFSRVAADQDYLNTQILISLDLVFYPKRVF